MCRKRPRPSGGCGISYWATPLRCGANADESNSRRLKAASLYITMLKRILKIRELVIFICALVTALVFYFIQPGASNRFLTPDNLKAILTGLAPDGLIAIG